MLHELRIYTTFPGQAPALAKLSAEVGREIRGDDHGKLEGYWLTEVGALNQVCHLWSYENAADREAKRAKLSTNADWNNVYLTQSRPLMQRQDTRIMIPARPIANPGSEGNIYEFRYYRCKPGLAKKAAGLLNEALVHREKYSKCAGLWTGDAGQPNEMMHLWAYESFEHRMEARNGAAADPGWKAFLGANKENLEEMHSMIMLPYAHSPLK
jgi:hypothetical protein